MSHPNNRGIKQNNLQYLLVFLKNAACSHCHFYDKNSWGILMKYRLQQYADDHWILHSVFQEFLWKSRLLWRALQNIILELAQNQATIVFCCIVAWIQPDISGCQQDFLLSEDEISWEHFRVYLRTILQIFWEAVSLEKIFGIVQKNIPKCSKLIQF